MICYRLDTVLLQIAKSARAIYTRYAKVFDADGSTLTVRDALTLINQTLDEVLAEQEGEFDADTRWAVAWFDEYGFIEGEFGVAETLSKAKKLNTTAAPSRMTACNTSVYSTAFNPPTMV